MSMSALQSAIQQMGIRKFLSPVPPIISNLRLDIDAVYSYSDVGKTSVCVTDGERVQVATDQSGLGFDAAQATEINRPRYKTNIFGKYPSIRATPTTGEIEALVIPHSFTTVVLNNVLNAKTTYCVVKCGANLGSPLYPIFAQYNVYTFELRHDYIKTSTYTDAVYYATYIASNLNKSFILSSVHDGVNLKLYVNGTLRDSPLVAATTGGADAWAYVAANTIGDNPYQIDLGRLLVYNTAHDETQRGSVEAWLSAYYGIPLV
jgi:hypothetical protein